MFKAVLAMVLGFLGMSELPKNAENKHFLTEADKEKLSAEFGQEFVEKFEKNLKNYKEEAKGGEGGPSVAEMAAQFSGLNASFEAFKREAAEKEKELNAKIEKMAKDPVNENVEVIEGENGKEATMKFKPNMNLRHNKVLAEAYKTGRMQYTGNSTIDTAELRAEFGNYIDLNRREVMFDLVGEVDSTQYMTTVITDKTEWQASKAQIESVVQQFTPYWTPSTKAKITPLKIKNFKHKINVPIKPSDIMTDILGYLYDEKLSPEQMPIVKFILTQLVMPKVAEDREMRMLATGKFVESNPDKDGDAASPAEESMDGYVTILKDLHAANKEIGAWLLPDVELTEDNIFDQIDIAVENISRLYKKKTMFIHADPNLVTMYGRAYRKKYPYTKNEDGEKVKVDFSKFTFAPLEGMLGTGAFFLTPDTNFKHLLSQNPDEMSVRIEVINYDVKLFAEWWEAVGFAMAEGVFAYLPPVAEGSTGGGL